jgi:hypothetical protein
LDANSGDFSVEEVERGAHRQGWLAAFQVFLVGVAARYVVAPCLMAIGGLGTTPGS